MGDNPGEIGLVLATVTMIGLIILGGMLLKVMKELDDLRTALSEAKKSKEL